jgi:hypothetical protein
LICFCTIWSVDEKKELTYVKNTHPSAINQPCDAEGGLYRVLLGTIHVDASNLLNHRGVEGVFFSFGDLSVRTEGEYKLKFLLFDISSQVFFFQVSIEYYISLICTRGHSEAIHDPQKDVLTTGKGNCIAYTYSEAFTVYNSKKFPGMMGSFFFKKIFFFRTFLLIKFC